MPRKRVKDKIYSIRNVKNKAKFSRRLHQKASKTPELPGP
jgi:hypothetical protein